MTPDDRCQQMLVDEAAFVNAVLGDMPCNRSAADPIHAEGAYCFKDGVIGAHIPHEFVESADE